jgi:hypothetical protein
MGNEHEASSIAGQAEISAKLDADTMSIARAAQVGAPVECPSCGRRVSPWTEANQDGTRIERCPSADCLAPIRAIRPQTEALRPKLALVPEPATIQPRPIASTSRAPAPVDASGMLAMAQARLDYVRAEVAKLAALQAELTVLEGMVQASGAT